MNTPYSPQQSAFGIESRHNQQNTTPRNPTITYNSHNGLVSADQNKNHMMVSTHDMGSNQMIGYSPNGVIALKQEKRPQLSEYSPEILWEKVQNVFTAIWDLFLSLCCVCINFIVGSADSRQHEQRLIDPRIHQNSSDPIFDPNHPNNHKIYKQHENNTSGHDYTTTVIAHTDVTPYNVPRKVANSAPNYQDFHPSQNSKDLTGSPSEYDRVRMEMARGQKYLNSQPGHGYHLQNGYYAPTSNQGMGGEQVFGAPSGEVFTLSNHDNGNSQDPAGGRTSYRFRSYNLEIYGKPSQQP